VQKKEVWATLLINFFFPGGGHLYASGGKEGMPILVGSLVCWVLTPFVYVTGIPILIFVVITMAQSQEITGKYNLLLEDDEEDRRASNEARLAREREVTEEAALKQKREVKGEALARQYRQISTLVAADVLSEAEACEERKKLIVGAMDGWIAEDVTAFLTPFAPLKSEGVVSDEDLAAVKSLYKTLPKEG
jgi:hypothetical protein